jgi:hypothetical protein
MSPLSSTPVCEPAVRAAPSGTPPYASRSSAQYRCGSVRPGQRAGLPAAAGVEGYALTAWCTDKRRIFPFSWTENFHIVSWRRAASCPTRADLELLKATYPASHVRGPCHVGGALTVTAAGTTRTRISRCSERAERHVVGDGRLFEKGR